MINMSNKDYQAKYEKNKYYLTYEENNYLSWCALVGPLLITEIK